MIAILRGYQRRLVCLKKTDSPIIDEAYFLIRDGVDISAKDENFIKEANRIIEENAGSKKKGKGKLIPFLMGAALAFSLTFSLFILTRLWGFH